MKLTEITVGIYQEEDYFRMVLECDCERKERKAIETQRFDISNTRERRAALDGFFSVMSQTIRKHVFPKDSRIVDIVETPTGIKAMNPRWPEDDVKAA